MSKHSGVYWFLPVGLTMIFLSLLFVALAVMIPGLVQFRGGIFVAAILLICAGMACLLHIYSNGDEVDRSFS